MGTSYFVSGNDSAKGFALTNFRAKTMYGQWKYYFSNKSKKAGNGFYVGPYAKLSYLNFSSLDVAQNNQGIQEEIAHLTKATSFAVGSDIGYQKLIRNKITIGAYVGFGAQYINTQTNVIKAGIGPVSSTGQEANNISWGNSFGFVDARAGLTIGYKF